VRSNGLLLPRKPEEGVPRLPWDITDLTDMQLMQLLSGYTQWASYLGIVVAQAEIDEMEAENNMETLGAQIMVANWKGTSADRVTLAKATRETDPEYLKARTAYAEARAYRKMVCRLYDNVDGEKATVSRELTRRVGREPAERRDRRWNT
jgi:hypothetical protein